jgi:hypothetical protein
MRKIDDYYHRWSRYAESVRTSICQLKTKDGIRQMWRSFKFNFQLDAKLTQYANFLRIFVIETLEKLLGCEWRRLFKNDKFSKENTL